MARVLRCKSMREYQPRIIKDDLWILVDPEDGYILKDEDNYREDATFSYIEPFKDGYAIVNKGGNWKYKGADAKIIATSSYAYIPNNCFCGGKWGIINKYGELIVPCEFDCITNAHDGIVRVAEQGSRSLEFRDECPQIIESFECGIFYFRIMGPRGVLRRERRLTECGNINYGCDFENGFALIEKGRSNEKKYLYINTEGKIITGLDTYDDGRNFYEGYACVGKLCKLTNRIKYGYINKEGKLVIPTIYDEAASFYKGQAITKMGDKTVIIKEVLTVVDSVIKRELKTEIIAPTPKKSKSLFEFIDELLTR